jgi:hypothetical protein
MPTDVSRNTSDAARRKASVYEISIRPQAPPQESLEYLDAESWRKWRLVMDLDKSIGMPHVLGHICKPRTANRTGVEYVWFKQPWERPARAALTPAPTRIRTLARRMGPHQGGKL